MKSIVDLHCDTIMRFYKGEHFRDMQAHITREKILKSGVMAQCFAIFVPTNDAAERDGIIDGPQEYFDKAYAAFHRELELNSDILRQAFTVEDILRNKEEGIISAILTVEDGVNIDGKLENIDKFYELGVRMVALTWNYENSIGFPNSKNPELHRLGLKPFGIDAVRRMNELGIIVDVSHLSEGGFWDVAKYSNKPFIASHSCARAISSHSRNLTDEQLRAIAEHGGVVGINFATAFLREGVNYGDEVTSTYEEVAQNLLYMKKVAGTDILAFGSDFDGIDNGMEWKDCAGMPGLVDYLSRYFTGSELDKLCHENAMRMFKETL